MSGSTADPLSPEFDVVLKYGEDKTVITETYVFRKPGIYHRIELGYRAAEVRRKAYPLAGGVLDFGVDRATVDFARDCAILEMYLVRSDQSWPFTPGEGGKPVVDSSKFPPEREQTVWDIGEEFSRQVERFRARRNPAGPPAGDEAVGGQPNPG